MGTEVNCGQCVNILYLHYSWHNDPGVINSEKISIYLKSVVRLSIPPSICPFVCPSWKSLLGPKGPSCLAEGSSPPQDPERSPPYEGWISSINKSVYLIKIIDTYHTWHITVHVQLCTTFSRFAAPAFVLTSSSALQVTTWAVNDPPPWSLSVPLTTQHCTQKSGLRTL